MVKYQKQFAEWLKTNNPAFYNQYTDMFNNGRDVFSLLGESFADDSITPKDLIARMQGELPLIKDETRINDRLFVAYNTPINPSFLGLMVRAADYGIKINEGCPNYQELKNKLAASYRVKIIDSPSLAGVISYRISKFKAFIKTRKYNRMLKRAENATRHGKTFTRHKLDLHSISNTIRIDNMFHTFKSSEKYRIGNNEKLLNVVNAFARNITDIFFDRKGKYFLDANTDKHIKAATSLLSTLFVSRAMNWGDIAINTQIEEALKIQVSQTLASMPKSQGNIALKKIRQETIEVTKYMMHKQGLSLEDFVVNSERMGKVYQTKPRTLEEAMFGRQNFELQETKTSTSKPGAEEKSKTKTNPKTEAEAGVVRISRMDLIRELSKQIDESFDSSKNLFVDDEALATATSWYFNAYQSTINKTANSSYTKIKKLGDFKTNPQIIETRNLLLKSLANSVVQSGSNKEIDFTDKQLAELQGEYIAEEMIKAVSKNFKGRYVEVQVPNKVKNTKSNAEAYNQMISKACNEVFEGIMGQTVKSWIEQVVDVKPEAIKQRETQQKNATLNKIKKAGIDINL